jgi:serine/threonine-protein kinase
MVPVARDVCSPRWSPTGHLLLSHSDGSLQALPFDPDRLEATGPSVQVLSGLAVNDSRARFQLTRTGALLYVGGSSIGGGAEFQLVMVGLDGSDAPIPIPPTGHPDAGFSPNGQWLAYTKDQHIWIYDMNLGDHRPFTTLGLEHHNPVWSPDGEQMAYGAIRAEGSSLDLYVQTLTGDSAGRHLGGTAVNDAPTQWLPDGVLLLNVDVPSDIATLHTERPGAPVAILQADWDEINARVSPDGKWLAYRSTEAGRPQLTVRSWPGLGQKVVIADSIEAEHHYWSNDNHTLYYVRQGSIMAASLVGTDSLRSESHRVVVETLGGILGALHPDGRRFLVFRPVASEAANGQTPRRSLIVVTGWLAELRRKLAEGGPRNEH